MADGVEIKVTGGKELIVAFGKASGSVLPKVDSVMKHGAENVKKGMAEDIRKSKHFRRVADTVSYDSAYRFGAVGYEVGPDADRDKVAHLANIMYFGGANGGGGTVDVDAALTREEPGLVKALDDILGGLL